LILRFDAAKPFGSFKPPEPDYNLSRVGYFGTRTSTKAKEEPIPTIYLTS